MCSRHRPEAGADSEPVGHEPGECEDADCFAHSVDEDPMVELPRAIPSMVEVYVREALGPSASETDVRRQVSEVVMADSLGRAIHQAKTIGGPWPGPCVRRKRDGTFEPVPYAWTGDNFDCECESMALHLIELMKTQQAVADVVAASKIVMPPRKGMN